MQSTIEEDGNIYFIYRSKLEYGFALYIIGSSSELGKWVIQKAHRMDCFNESIWIKRISLKNCEKIEYKFFISTYKLDLRLICWIEFEIGPFKNYCIESKEIQSHLMLSALNTEFFNKIYTNNENHRKPTNVNKLVKIMSFNILYDNIKRGELFNWENRKDKVFKILKDTAPDIIGFQEILPNQANDLKSAFGNVYNYYGIGRNHDFTGEQSGIFVNKFKYDIVNSGTFWLSANPDVPGSNTFKGYFPRIATWVRLRNIEEFYFGSPEDTFKDLLNSDDLKRENKISDDFDFEKHFNKKGEIIDRKNLIKGLFTEQFFKEKIHKFTKREIFSINTHYDHISEHARVNSSFVILKFVEEKLKKIFSDHEQNFKQFKKLRHINKSDNKLKEHFIDEIKSEEQNEKEHMELINDYQRNKYKYYERVQVIVFFTGDFNSDDNSRELKYLKKNLFYSFSDLTRNNENTFHDYIGEAFSKIDHIFFRVFNIDENFAIEKMRLFPKEDSPKFCRTLQQRRRSSEDLIFRQLLNESGVKKVNYEVIKNKVDEIYPSDHFPVLGLLEFD